MEEKNDYSKLVKQAQLGDKKSRDRLAELVQERLRTDIYRLTMQYDLTEEIVQESMLEMFKILGKLREADRFWPWLYKIALNKINLHYRDEQHHKTMSMSAAQDADVKGDGREVVANLIGQELKDIVFAAMQQLRPRHRAVLIMRCYREMEYSLIAESMQCSEFAARMLFYRAKKSLQKQLSRSGFGKGSLLTALILFGKMTAPTEAAAAQVSVTSATASVGITAGLAGMMSSKATVISLTTAGVLAVGTMVATSGPDETMAMYNQKPADNLRIMTQADQAGKYAEQYWYYFPKGTAGAMITRLVKGDSQGKKSYCRQLQNEQANYSFDRRKNSIYINNCRMWRDDLAVWRLPTDSPQLTEFLTSVEGQTEQTEYISGDGEGLLVVARRDKDDSPLWATYHYNVLNEEYFRYNWPAGTKVVDNRDIMHQRGWTYFKVSGEVDGKRVSGRGRMPFTYETSEQYQPWLRLQAGDKEITEAGSFAGLSRPWMGLHTIDTVRRDAAEKKVWFEAKYTPAGDKAQVMLTKGRSEVVYIIDMEKDVIDKITFSTSDGSGRTKTGEMIFTYLQEINQAGNKFVKPRSVGSYGTSQRKPAGMLWLMELAN